MIIVFGCMYGYKADKKRKDYLYLSAYFIQDFTRPSLLDFFDISNLFIDLMNFEISKLRCKYIYVIKLIQWNLDESNFFNRKFLDVWKFQFFQINKFHNKTFGWTRRLKEKRVFFLTFYEKAAEKHEFFENSEFCALGLNWRFPGSTFCIKKSLVHLRERRWGGACAKRK